MSTLNRTTLSYLIAIVMAEKVFGYVPDGTHEWDKFVTPDELNNTLTHSKMFGNHVV